jgi:hypothetical protein
MTDDEVGATLTDVPCIGPWTARGFLVVALGPPDVFLARDLALRRAIRQAYGFDHPPTEDEVEQVSDRCRPTPTATARKSHRSCLPRRARSGDGDQPLHRREHRGQGSTSLVHSALPRR